jgi:hypothetical protein
VKYKPGDLVVVTRVPDRAKRLVHEGMPAYVVEFNNKNEAVSAQELGLVMVQIGLFTYWWAEGDLGFHQ